MGENTAYGFRFIQRTCKSICLHRALILRLRHIDEVTKFSQCKGTCIYILICNHTKDKMKFPFRMQLFNCTCDSLYTILIVSSIH